VKFYGAKKTKTSASWWQRSRKCLLSNETLWQFQGKIENTYYEISLNISPGLV
jgi:hypothetical protein